MLEFTPMAFDPFESAIQALPQPKLNGLGREIDAQIAELQDQRRKVDKELAERQSDTASAHSGSRQRPQRPSRRGARSVGKKRRATIQKIVDAEPEKQWLPVDLEAQLHATGDTSASRDSVRNIVREMVNAGEVARHPSGNGVISNASELASTNGSHQEPLTEANNLGPEPTRSATGTT